MTSEKFEQEIIILKRFYELYCKDKHHNQSIKNISHKYKNKEFQQTLNLCEDCYKTINYSFDRLQSCPHEIKPRCRTCPSPCYDKTQWKNTAKIMKYSGMKLGLTKIKSKIKNLFS